MCGSRSRRCIAIAVALIWVSGDARAESPIEIGVGAFAATRAEFTSTGGGILLGSDASPPVTEYRRLEEWDPHEPTASPERFDAVAVVTNRSSKEIGGASVDIDVFANIGPIVVDRRADAADIGEGERRAQWEPRPFAATSFSLGTLGPGESRSVTMAGVRLKQRALELHDQSKWPYAIKVVATADCAECADRIVTSYVIDVNPGD